MADEPEDDEDDGPEGPEDGKQTSTPADAGCKVEDKPAGDPAKPCKYAAEQKAKEPPADPVIRELLKVYDAEEKGARYWSSRKGLIQIVQKDKTDEVTITYKGPKVPPHLEMSRNGDFVKNVPGGGTYRAQVTYMPPTSPYSSSGSKVLDSLQTWRHPPTIYTFTYPDWGHTVRVEVFNPDQWKMKVKLPPVSKYKVGVKLDNVSITKTKTVTKEEAAKGEVTGIKVEIGTSVSYEKKKMFHQGESQTLSAFDEWKTKANSWEKADSWEHEGDLKLTNNNKGKSDLDYLSDGIQASPALSLTCNGVEVTIDYLHLIGSVINLIKSVEKIIELLRKCELKIGWYAELEASFFQGSAELAWGWREYTNYQVYYYQGITATLKIFEIGCELGFGVEFTGFEAQLCVKLTGEASYAITPYEVGKPGAKKSDEIALGEAEFKLTLGSYFRLKAGSAAGFEAGLEAPISIKFEGKHTSDHILQTENEVVCGGLSLTITVTYFAASTPHNVPLLDGGSLGKWQWPSDHTKDHDQLESKEEVADILKEQFEAGWFALEFYQPEITPGRIWGTNTTDVTIQTKYAAERVANYVWRQRRYINVTKKDMEGLALAIRNDLDELGYRRFRHSKISNDQLNSYLQGPAFHKRLEDQHSISKKYMATISQG